MNARKAKKLRKEAYGDRSIRDRKYRINQVTGVIVADVHRTIYQQSKKL